MDTVNVAKIIGTILAAALSIAAVVAIIGVAYAQFKKAFRNERVEAINSADTLAEFWHKQADEYKDAMALKDEKYTEQINKLTRELGEVRGELNAAKASNERLEKIFQGRDPEMQEFMRFMIQAVKDQAETHQKIVKVLDDIHNMSKSNHSLLEDESKVKIEGKLVKTPVSK
jgi:hypothetical protein